MTIVNIEEEDLISSEQVSMKFSGKMWLMIILNVAKNQGFTLSLKKHIFGKHTMEAVGQRR